MLQVLNIPVYLLSGAVMAFCAQLAASFPRSRASPNPVPDQQDDRYFFLNLNSRHCMPVRCLRLDGCTDKEFVAWYGGVEPCYGCPFCLDFPGMRAKRSLSPVKHVEDRLCEQVTCPEYLQPADASCKEASIWYGYVRNRKCRSCMHCDVKSSSKGHQHKHSKKSHVHNSNTGP